MTTFRTRQLRKEDFPGLIDAEPRFEEFLTAFNQMSKTLELILNGGVGTDNLNRQLVDIDISAAQTYPIKIGLKLTGKPIGCRLLRAVETNTVPQGEPVAEATHVDWRVDGSNLLIDGIPGVQPICAANYFASTAQSVPANTIQIINFNQLGVGDFYNTVTTGANWKFTTPHPHGGWYVVWAFVPTEATTGSTNSYNNLYLYRNGSRIRRLDTLRQVNANQVLHGAAIILMQEGDYLDVRYENTDNSQSRTIDAVGSPSGPCISIAKLGPQPNKHHVWLEILGG